MNIIERKAYKVVVGCDSCGKKVEIDDFPGLFGLIANGVPYYCDDCHEKQKRVLEEREFQEFLPRLIDTAGIPAGYLADRNTGKKMQSAPVPYVFDWVWEHRERNILLTGNTGTGKSTSACFAAVKLIEDRKKVRYVKLRALLSEWREAKTADSRFADEAFFRTISELDLLILDEVIDKAKTTESGQEMMFELLDRIADGELKTKLWMLGNFRPGSVIELFGDDAPVRRRIEENFVCAGIGKNKVEVFHVWNGKK